VGYDVDPLGHGGFMDASMATLDKRLTGYPFPSKPYSKKKKKLKDTGHKFKGRGENATSQRAIPKTGGWGLQEINRGASANTEPPAICKGTLQDLLYYAPIIALALRQPKPRRPKIWDLLAGPA